MPTVNGGNYFTYSAMGMNLDTMERAVKSGDIGSAYISYMAERPIFTEAISPKAKSCTRALRKRKSPNTCLTIKNC